MSTIKAIQYRYLTDGNSINRNFNDVIKILKETSANWVFESWVSEYQPLLQSCNSFTGDNYYKCEQSQYSYDYLKDAITKIKAAIPNISLGGGVLVEFLYQNTADPYTGKIYTQDELWAMALDPSIYGIPLSRTYFQCLFAALAEWNDGVCDCTDTTCTTYDPKTQMRAYFPDMNNTTYRELILNMIKKQIDMGVDNIWIDALFTQSQWMLIYANSNPLYYNAAMNCALQAYANASQLINDIHDYGLNTYGKHIEVITWGTPIEVFKPPFTPAPNLDGIITTVISQEILAGKPDEARWNALLTDIRNVFGNTNIYCRIDYGETSDAPTSTFTQMLTTDQQNAFLKNCASFFSKKKVTFIYPIHGSYMGKNLTKLSYGKSPFYDSLAPEFDNYKTMLTLLNPKNYTIYFLLGITALGIGMAFISPAT